MKEKGFKELNKNAQHRFGAWLKPWIRFAVPIATLLIFILSLIAVLEERGVIEKVFPSVEVREFVPLGIGPATVIMIVLACGLVWGGCLFLTTRAIITEKRKEKKT